MLTKPGFDAIAESADLISVPLISPDSEFQLHLLVTPSGLIDKLSPVLPKNVYMYHPELNSMANFFPDDAATDIILSNDFTSSAEK